MSTATTNARIATITSWDVAHGVRDIYALAKREFGQGATPLVIEDARPGERVVGYVRANCSGPRYPVVIR